MTRIEDNIENKIIDPGFSQEPCDVIIMCTAGNLRTLKKMLPYCAVNILHDHIYVVASRNIEESVNALPFAEFVDEDSVLEGMRLSVIADIIESISGERRRAGWYFQQFLKMAWAMRCPDRYYIVIDADTFPLHPITFLQDGKYLLTEKIEYNQPYFDTLAVLFNGEIGRVCGCSFVAENMIFDCEVMKEMIMKIENNASIRGGHSTRRYYMPSTRRIS